LDNISLDMDKMELGIRWLTFFALLLLPGIASGGLFTGFTSSSKASTKQKIHDATIQDIYSSLQHWDGDAVVMFYAPWCPHCKQLYPVMQDIATQMWNDGVKKVSFARFNCEESLQHMTVCENLDLKAYPTLMFFGQGKLPDSDPVSRVMYGTTGTPFENSATFNGVLYQLAIRDWILTAHTISKFNRRMQSFKEFLGFGSKEKSRVLDNMPSADEWTLKEDNKQLEEENKQLREQLGLLQDALKKDDAPHSLVEDSFESYEADGDAYEKAYIQGYTDDSLESLALRTCIADRSLEYCDRPGVAEHEGFCAFLEPCLNSNYEAKECRPPSCPFSDEGCRSVSVCLNDVVLADYQELVTAYLNGNMQAA